MEIIFNELGKVTAVYDLDEVPPIAGVFGPSVSEALAARYSFVRLPNLEERRNDRIYEQGRLVVNNGNVNIHQMVIYRDGIQVDGYDTDSALLVLADVVEFLKTEFGFREPKNPPNFIYENHVVVDFDSRISAAFVIYDELKVKLDKMLSSTYKLDAFSHFTGLSMAVDPGDPVKVSKREFTVVRRQGFPFTGKRFFSTAPLPTKGHHALLQFIDNAVGSK